MLDVTSTSMEMEEIEDGNEEDALIEQGLRTASDFLSTGDGEPAVMPTLADIAATAARDGVDLDDCSSTSSQRDSLINTALIPAHNFDGLDICQDNDLILSADQLRQIGQFRNVLRSCGSDSERFQICMDARDNLLGQQTWFDCFVARIEAVMSAECKEYKRKRIGWSKKTEGSDTSSEMDEVWERFVGVATNGVKAINKRLPCLRKVSSIWGKEKVQHYGWAYAGEKYCKVLSSASSQVPDWAEASTKLNQLILRRLQMARRQPLNHSVNPINQIDLENLKRWQDQVPYIKMNDPDGLSLHYQRLTMDGIPDGYGFDRYGVIVQGEFASTIKMRAMALFPEAGPANTSSERTSPSIPMPFFTTAEHQTEPEDPRSAVHGSADLERIPAPKTPASTHSEATPDEDGADTSSPPFGSALDGKPMPSAAPEVDGGVISDGAESTSEDSSRLASPVSSERSTASPERETTTLKASQMRSRTSKRLRLAPKHPYQESTTNVMKPPRRLRASATSRRGKVQCGCSSRIPEVFLGVLDSRTGPFQSNPSTLMAEQLAPYQRVLCVKHLQKFAHLTSTIALSHAEAFEQTGSNKSMHLIYAARRRSRSLPDIGSELPVYKRQRLAETESPFLAGAGTNNSQHRIEAQYNVGRREERDHVAHGCHGSLDYREQVLAQLGLRIRLKKTNRGSWGEMNEQAMFCLLSRASPPKLEGPDDEVDAYYLTGEEAADRVESTKPLEVPIIVSRQQQFRWRNTEARPIAQLFHRMEDLERTVSIQKPSLPLSGASCTLERLSNVQDRFLDDDDTDDAWNVLDLRSPLPPSILPAFLTGENCQLLARVRDAVLRGDTAERTTASVEEWNRWRDVEHWALLAQGGALTLRHQDSKGLSTWLTVQEGKLGLGWMSRPTQEELDAWMVNPVNYAGGRIREIVLVPGQTVFLPSGLIHFVFRLAGKGRQTLALGGHILRWSCLDIWIKTILDQLRHPNITNEEIQPTVEQYVRAVASLVLDRQRRGRIEELGGDDTISRFFALYEVSIYP